MSTRDWLLRLPLILFMLTLFGLVTFAAVRQGDADNADFDAIAE